MSKQIDDFIKLANQEYKLHSKIAKFYNDIEKDESNTQKILKTAYDLKHVSKQNVINIICKTIDKTEPLYINSDAKKLMLFVNNLNYQHDAKLSKLLNLFKNKELEKFQNKSKKLVNNINKNYNNYYEIWHKMKELESSYKEGYDTYQSTKNKYKNGEIKIPKTVAKYITSVYDKLTQCIIPEFKKYDKILTNIEAERKELVDKFNQLYVNVNDEQFKYITLPLTGLDIYKKCFDVVKRKKAVAKVPICLDRSWDDAIEDGFNITLFSPCNVIKQTDILECNPLYDWPYIEYEPNLFIAWDLGQNQLEWIGRCFTNKVHRPYIGV